MRAGPRNPLLDAAATALLHWMQRLLLLGALLLAAAVLGCLGGCGGGDDDPADGRNDRGPVDCRANPKLCV